MSTRRCIKEAPHGAPYPGRENKSQKNPTNRKEKGKVKKKGGQDRMVYLHCPLP